MESAEPSSLLLSDLRTLTKAELVEAWSSTLGKPPAVTASRELLLYALAWHIQERRFGGLSAATRRKLEALARAFEQGKYIAARHIGQGCANI